MPACLSFKPEVDLWGVAMRSKLLPSRSAQAPSALAVPVIVYDEPLVEFFPRNSEPGARYYWRNQAEADSVAKQKAEMLAMRLKDLASGRS